jgi:uncharacterized cupin superfamily protein
MLDITTGTIPALDPWGTVAELGAEILEGSLEASGRMVFGAPSDPVSCGYFAVTRGRFRMTYPYTEHAVVVEGSVTLTDERTGKATTYGPGDAWFVEKGTPVLWEVTSDRFVKNYMGVA